MSKTATQHHIGQPILTNGYNGIGLFLPQSSIEYIGHLLTVYLTIEALNKATNEKHSTTAGLALHQGRQTTHCDPIKRICCLSEKSSRAQGSERPYPQLLPFPSNACILWKIR